MPIPAIVAQIGAALARSGAAVAARAGATGAARTLVAAGRTAATTASKKAIVQAATSSAAQTAAATTGQSAAGAVQAGGMRVLEDTTLNNARSLFQAIHGQTPGTAAAVSQAAPKIDPLLNAAKQISAADPKVTAAELQKSLGITGDRAKQLLGASQTAPGTGAQAIPATPAASPASPAIPKPAPANSAPAPQPQASPKPQGILDRASEAFSRAREAANQVRERFESVQDRVKSLSMDERYQRLQKAGKLLDPLQVGKQQGTPNPSREQVVKSSEIEEERQRQEANQQSRTGQVGQAAWSAGKKMLMAGVGQAITPLPMKAVTAPIWLYGIIRGFETLGRTLSETNRDLSKFDSRIADSFARLDYQQFRSRQRMAGATSGSASMLNDQLGKLIKEVEPLRESVTTFLNLAGGSLVGVARFLALIIKWHPLIVGMGKAAEAAEKWFGKKDGEVAQAAAKELLRDIRDGNFSRRPGPGGK